MASYYTGAEGCPYPNPTTSVQLRNGSGGGLVLLQDTQLIETLAHFNRERIPERVVHAKAAGAYGEFECTHDCTDITSASFLSNVGKKSDVLLRISTVGPERGSADTTRDVHGWGMKIYTDEGNQDFVCNNIPVFFVRDPIKFPSLNRSHKRHPQTNLSDSDMFWDFHLGNPEGIHALMHLFNDRGTPASLRNINAYSGHTYKFTKEDGTFKYIKLHIKAQTGVKNFTADVATKTAGENPDYLTQDLFEAIEQGNFPKWDVFVQVMDPKEAETYRWNIFDMTKVWPHRDFPLRQIGVLTLNRNPQNYFTDIEQAAFSPSTMVPGIAPSADPMLQARMFAYPDAARYRLGVNYQQLPTNRSKAPVYTPFQRDGFMNFSDNYGADPNYVNSSLKPTPLKAGGGGGGGSTITEHERWVGEVSSFTSEVGPEDFEQATALWRVLGGQEGHQERFVGNVAGHLSRAKNATIRSRVYEYFSHVDKELGSRLREVTEAKVAA
ncbi:catalase-domain-containing protein [Trichoderma reesei RUT C-30]|uniref:Catalase-domain-containing protein n=1 Tax=Hypocrea jecorina (strain ATCC 56765 / BCRC 32924 / NRRL 11460 / Rut C-30) TaxID=1344414 RepID=A0A024S197_HYPJR|nr:catalase-domain-containing protein [Trichoderma reesei RUT C-30]